jgi:hypothetical protein
MAKKNSVYFNGVSNLNELEAKFIELAAEHAADADTLAKIAEEYDVLFVKYQKTHNKGKEEWQKVTENPHEMREVVTKLFAFVDEENDLDFKRDCKVELCGSWLWIQPADGKDPDTTKKYSKLLNRKNGVGCNWSTKKNMWYWHSETGKKKWIPRKQSYSMEQIRSTYGSKYIHNPDEA